MAFFEVKSYITYLRSGPGSTKGFLVVSGSNGRATVRFVAGTPGAPAMIGASLRFEYPVEMMQTVIDMVRNEKPIYVIYNEDLTIVQFGTSEEPVGEEERS